MACLKFNDLSVIRTSRPERTMLISRSTRLAQAHPNYLQITIGYRKQRTVTLTTSRKKVGKVLARGTSQSVAVQCTRDLNSRRHVVEALGAITHSEIGKLCSERVQSVQRSKSAQSLKKFSWKSIINKAEECPQSVTAVNLAHKEEGHTQQKSGGCHWNVAVHPMQAPQSIFQRVLSVLGILLNRCGYSA